MNDEQRRSNITNRLLGQYQAEVVNTEHPDGLYLVSIRLLNLWDSISDDDLPWAEFLLPLGAKPSHGHAVPVESGDWVWVDFPRNGDTRYPRITGSLYHAPDYQSNLPDDVNGTLYEAIRADGEPSSPSYDRKDDLYQRFGLREHKTHAGGWSITHTATGTAIEITPSGQMVIHTEGDQFQSATGNHKGQYNGKLELIVKGACSITTNDKVAVKADGNISLDSGGEVAIKSGGNVNIESGGLFAVKATAAPFTLG